MNNPAEELVRDSSKDVGRVHESGANATQDLDKETPVMKLDQVPSSASKLSLANSSSNVGGNDNPNYDGMAPDELFAKMVLNNAKQNKNLSAKANGAGKISKRNGTGGKEGAAAERVTKMRFIVCTLGLASLAMSQMSRMVINQTITQMVDPSMKHDNGGSTKGAIETDGSCPWPLEEAPIIDDIAPEPTLPPPPPPSESTEPTELSEPTEPTEPSETPEPNSSPTIILEDGENMSDLPDFDDVLNEESLSSEMTPSEAPTGQPDEPTEPDLSSAADPVVLAATNETTDVGHVSQQQTTDPSSSTYDRFKWSMKQQGVIMGGFFYSYFVFMILGGRLAEVYGSKYVILLSVAGSALINLATPWMARTSFALLVVSRICMGAIQAGVFPAMYALISKWLTMSEASIFAPLIKMNLRLGMVLGSLIPGIIPGWPNVFYFTGFLSVIWSIAWMIVASSDPADNKWVSAGELRHIIKKKKHAKQKEEMIMIEESDKVGRAIGEQVKERPKRSLKTPWLKIWTAPSVIGLIIVKLTFNFALDFLAIELPTYLKYVHHASRQTISAITTPMFGIQVGLIFFVGWLAKVVVQKRPLNLSKTAIRKLFQGTANLGIALCFFLLTFNDCNLMFVAVMLQIISFLSMFASGGEVMLPYDLSEEYPATIMSIANSIANLSGITVTTMTSLVLGDEGSSYDRWNLLIYLIVGANVFGGLAFILLVKAEPIDFSSSKSKTDENQSTPSTSGIDIESKIRTTEPLEMVDIKLNEPKSS